MDARRRAIETLNAEISRHTEENRRRLESLGEILAGLEPPQVGTTELESDYEKVRQLQKELPLQRRQIRGIVGLAERHRNVREKLAETRRTIGDLQHQSEEVCEEIGRAAFAAYKKIPSQEMRYGEIFSRLEELDRGLAQGDARIEALAGRARDSALPARIKLRGEIAYRKSMLGLRKRALAGAYRKAGREICESEFADALQDPAFLQAVQPYRENRKAVLALEKQKGELEARQEAIWTELKSLGAEKGHEKRIRELEKIVASTELELRNGCRALGLLFKKSPVPALAENEEIKAVLSDIARADKAMARNRKQIQRLEADLQAEQVARELEKIREQIVRLDEEISSRQREAAALEQSLRDGEAERQRLLKRRGPESTLLEIEAPRKKGKSNP